SDKPQEEGLINFPLNTVVMKRSRLKRGGFMKILKALSLILQCVKLAMDLWERFGGKWPF
ncbi:hypothetical protein, partial [Klebsiella pneumoniae]|uniref:hypothetical protein n=1 Tax=Klebsiella pneumoniae TaxID=573 RepID=UPI001A92EC70